MHEIYETVVSGKCQKRAAENTKYRLRSQLRDFQCFSVMLVCKIRIRRKVFEIKFIWLSLHQKLQVLFLTL